MKKVTIAILILTLAFGSQALASEEIKVPFSAIKSSCYGKIDMSKSEFALSEIGEECVSESWLEENLPYEKAKKGDDQKIDRKSRIKLVGEKSAADFSWKGTLEAGEEKEITITVQDKKFVHSIGENPTVTFLVFHDSSSGGWGKAIQEPNKQEFTGPGGFVEKTELPVEKSGDEWVGKTMLLPQKMIRQIALWESPSGGKHNKHVTLLVRVFGQTGEKTKETDEQDQKQEGVLKLVGEKGAADFDWNGPLIFNEEKVVEITVHDEIFVHGIEGEPSITFLVFHDGPSGWGKALQEPNKQKFTGPGGHVEKAELPADNKGDVWVAKTTLLPQKSITRLALWENPSGGKHNKHVTLHVNVLSPK